MSPNFLTCLFIGGPADGQRRYVDANRSVITVVESFPYSALTMGMIEAPTIRHVDYRRQQLRGKDARDHYVYMIDDSCPLEALLNGYRPAKETR